MWVLILGFISFSCVSGLCLVLDPGDRLLGLGEKVGSAYEEFADNESV